MTVRFFDPKRMELSYAGFALQDPAEDFISVSFDRPRFSMVQGIDGDAAKIRNPLRAGRIRVTLMQGSPSNNRLTEILLVDEISGLASFPFLARDRNGGTVIFAATAFLTSIPPIDFGITPKNRIWEFLTDNLLLYLGGKAPSERYQQTTENTIDRTTVTGNTRNPFPPELNPEDPIIPSV